MAAPAKAGGQANPASKCNFVAQDQIWYVVLFDIVQQ